MTDNPIDLEAIKAELAMMEGTAFTSREERLQEHLTTLIAEVEALRGKNMKLSRDAVTDSIKRDRQSARGEVKVAELQKANEHWHVRVRALKADIETAEALNRDMRTELEWIAHEAGQYADGVEDGRPLAQFLTVVEQRARAALARAQP